MMYFDNINSLEELKSAYKALALKNHPDMGGDLRIMQAINAEYDSVFARLKDAHNAEAAKSESRTRATTETPEAFREIIDKLIRIPDINIELCGSWLWIDGDTKPHREELKAAKCRWSRSKQKWYWRHPEKGCTWSRGKQTMQQIREKYGSEHLGTGQAPLMKVS